MQDFIRVTDVSSHVGKEVSLRGWVYRKREQKEIVFLVLRDASGTVQVACKNIPEAAAATIESSIEIFGEVKEDKRAPGGFEISASKIKIIGLAERFPIGKDLSEEFLRDVRHLWIRSRKLTEIFKIRSAVFQAIREFYTSRGFYEVQSPSFTANAVEGGSTLFEVKFPGKKVFLSQSWQLYAEAMIFSLEKIFTIAPSFRAEKSRTIRHLAEYWHHEMETAWMGFDELLKLEEELIVFIAHHIAKTCKTELAFLKRDPKELESLKAPFKRMTYKEACKTMRKKFG